MARRSIPSQLFRQSAGYVFRLWTPLCNRQVQLIYVSLLCEIHLHSDVDQEGGVGGADSHAPY